MRKLRATIEMEDLTRTTSDGLAYKVEKSPADATGAKVEPSWLSENRSSSTPDTASTPSESAREHRAKRTKHMQPDRAPQIRNITSGQRAGRSIKNLRCKDTGRFIRKPNHLFKLPQELQDHIYKFVVVEDYCVDLKILHVRQVGRTAHFTCAPRPPLAAVCKTLRHDILCMYYQENTFHLNRNLPTSCFQKTFRAIEGFLGLYVQNLRSVITYGERLLEHCGSGAHHVQVMARLPSRKGSAIISRVRINARQHHDQLECCVCDLMLVDMKSLYQTDRDGRRLLEIAKASFIHGWPRRNFGEGVCGHCALPLLYDKVTGRVARDEVV